MSHQHESRCSAVIVRPPSDLFVFFVVRRASLDLENKYRHDVGAGRAIQPHSSKIYERWVGSTEVLSECKGPAGAITSIEKDRAEPLSDT